MSVPSGIEARRYYRVAQQHLQDAEYLLEGKRLNGCCYLAGYAVECMLKALLIHRTPVKQRTAIQDFFKGNLGHNLEELRAAVNQCGVNFNKDIQHQFRVVNSVWNTALRYSPGAFKQEPALRFFSAAKEFVFWLDRRI